MAQLRPSSPARDHSDRIDVDLPEKLEVSSEEVSFSVSSEEITRLDDGTEHFDIIGQPRALKALRLAIDIEGKGYNIFATGLAGTGKRTAIMKVLKSFTPRKSKVRDIAVVHNFKQPDRPRVLYFRPGEASRFRDELAGLVDTFRRTLGALTLDQEYKKERDALVLEAEGRETQKVSEFEQKLKAEGFEIV